MERGAVVEASLPEATPRHGVASILCNIALAAFYSLFIAAHFVVEGERDWTYSAPIVVQETVMVLLFLTRRPSSATTSSPIEWGVGVAGTLSPMLLRLSAISGELTWLGRPLQTIGVLLSIVALLSIGRSIGVVPADRGIRTGGAYRIVRHPVYSAYIVTFTGYLMCSPTARNAAVVVVSLLLLGARAVFEERFLMRDARYRDYAQRVRWRMLPWLF